jgi:hypothetical protein
VFPSLLPVLKRDLAINPNHFSRRYHLSSSSIRSLSPYSL